MTAVPTSWPKPAADGPYCLLLNIIEAVGKANICILHGYEDLANGIPSDVDVLLTQSARHEFLTRSFDGWRIVQHLRHETSCDYFVLVSWGRDRAPEYLLFDVATDYRRNGCVFYGKEVLDCSERNPQGLPIPAPEHEFGYYLVKKLAKGDLDGKHGGRLSALWRRNPDACHAELRRFFRYRSAQTIAGAASAADWGDIVRRKRTLRRTMLLRTAMRSPLSSLCYWPAEAIRILRRCLNPTGLTVCVLGPDGAGKSTVIQAVEQHAKRAFRSSMRAHLRHRFRSMPKNAPPVTVPHARPPYGLALSLTKLVYLLPVYWVGFLAIGLPKKLRSTLILFDRYFHDLLADPLRYRYGGPMWLASMFARLMPTPDIFIILDAQAPVLQSRKSEVPAAESGRQRQAYLYLAKQLPNAHVIDASQPMEQVARDTTAIVLNHMAERTRQRLRTAFR